MQSANQFTPDQLIVAGRRAEAQGQPAYALQFYRYVADHFPASTEAYEARDALFRLTPPADQPVSQRASATSYGAPPQPAPAAHQTASHVGHGQASAPPAQAYGAPGPASLGQASLGQASLGEVRPHHESPPAPPSRARADRPKAKARRAAEAEAYEPQVLRPARGYRIGRVVAAMLNTIGWLSFIGAIAMIPLMMAAMTVKAMPKGLKEYIAGNLLIFGGGTFGLLLIGLFSIFAAQVARATFDTADATRALYEANSGAE